MRTAELILKILDLAVVGAMSFDRLQALRAKVATIVAEGREPTDDEWAALIGDIDEASARLDAADHRLND
jgi:hypothetical protein